MKSFTALLLALCCALGVGSAQVGPFVAPAEGPLPFRRDRLPLDVASITRLAAELVTLTSGLDFTSPSNRRTAAQLLGLAIALDPANQTARTTIDSLKHGDAPPEARNKDLERAKARVWTSLNWLEDPAADTDGQSLAACLADVIAVADPDHPRAGSLTKTGERGSWTRWIDDLHRFEEKVIAVNKTPDEETTTPEPDTTLPQSTATIRLKEATIHTPLWNHDKTTRKTTLLCLPVSMKVGVDPPDEETGEARPFRLRLEKTEATDTTRRLNETLVKAITNAHGPLPENTRISLTIADGSDYLPASNSNSISAAAALLMNAAFSGTEPEATVIGVIDESGALQLPYRFWEKLRAVEAGPGGKLVLPASAAAYLPSLLALEKSDFFFKYEVLLASNLAELIERTSSTTEGPTAATTEAFVEVRTRIGSQTVPQYVSNSFVRQRLAAIAQENPHHFSARMLTVQGAGERPTVLPRNILASELRTAILPMAWIGRDPESRPNPADLDATYTACRTAIDALDRYVDRRDREFQEKVRSLINSIRSLSRTTRAPVREGGDSSVATRAAVALQASYQAMRAELATITGDEEPKNPPANNAAPPS